MCRKTTRGVDGRVVLLTFTLTLLFGLLSLAGPGEAVPIAGFTGNTFLGNANPDAVDGTVNYAVFTTGQFSADAAGILSSFVRGLGSPALDLTTPGFVYLFQPTNNGLNTAVIAGFTASTGSGPITAWGFFTDRVFVDDRGVVGATNNLGDDTQPSGGSTLPRTGISAVGFAIPLTAAIDPTLLVPTSTSVRALYGGPIGPGGTSSVIVYTSPNGPDFFSSHIDDSGTSAFGPTPGPGPAVPEPGTLLLVGSGLLGLASLGRRRHRKGGI